MQILWSPIFSSLKNHYLKLYHLMDPAIKAETKFLYTYCVTHKIP